MSQDVKGHISNLWGLILGNVFREIDERRDRILRKWHAIFQLWWEAYSVLEMTWQWRISANLHFLPTMSTLSISWSRQSISKLQKRNSANLCKKSRIRYIQCFISKRFFTTNIFELFTFFPYLTTLKQKHSNVLVLCDTLGDPWWYPQIRAKVILLRPHFFQPWSRSKLRDRFFSQWNREWQRSEGWTPQKIFAKRLSDSRMKTKLSLVLFNIVYKLGWFLSKWTKMLETITIHSI